jgi:hypothetical protein
LIYPLMEYVDLRIRHLILCNVNEFWFTTLIDRGNQNKKILHGGKSN